MDQRQRELRSQIAVRNYEAGYLQACRDILNHLPLNMDKEIMKLGEGLTCQSAQKPK